MTVTALFGEGALDDGKVILFAAGASSKSLESHRPRARLARFPDRTTARSMCIRLHEANRSAVEWLFAVAGEISSDAPACVPEGGRGIRRDQLLLSGSGAG